MANSESRRGAPISLIIVHTNEGDNKPDDVGNDHTAENLAGYCNRECAAGRGKSYHKIIDDDSTVIMVPDDQAAWSARSANRRSLNLCLTGWARWSRAEWLRHPTMLARAGREIRAWSNAHGIPLVKLTPAQVGADARGVCGHGDWATGKHDGNHTDPGPHFPWDVVLALPGQSSATKGRSPVSVQLEPTIRHLTEDRPGPGWPSHEQVIAIPDTAWVTVVFGNGGAWVQTAWWGERGQDIVSPGKPLYVEQFKVQRWTAPDWAEYLTIRYAAPAGGSVGLGQG